MMPTFSRSLADSLLVEARLVEARLVEALANFVGVTANIAATAAALCMNSRRDGRVFMSTGSQRFVSPATA